MRADAGPECLESQLSRLRGLLSVPLIMGSAAPMTEEPRPAATSAPLATTPAALATSGLPPAHVRQALRRHGITVTPYREHVDVSAREAIRTSRNSLYSIAGQHPGRAWLVRFTDHQYGPVENGHVRPIYQHRPAWLVQIRHADPWLSGPMVAPGLERPWPHPPEGTLYVLVDPQSGRFLTAAASSN